MQALGPPDKSPLQGLVASRIETYGGPAEPQGKPKNTEVGSLSLLQQIFLTQELL